MIYMQNNLILIDTYMTMVYTENMYGSTYYVCVSSENQCSTADVNRGEKV